MSKKKKQKRAREEPGTEKRTGAWLCSQDAFEILTAKGYTSLSHNPEIIAGVDTIAKLIGSMTIHLLRNTENGDVRVQDELSRKMDIYPSANMTRSTFIQWIVRTLYLEGNGNAIVYPKFRKGYLADLMPIPAGQVSLIADGIWNYTALFGGKKYRPDQILHFVLAPGSYYPWKGEGLRVPLADVAGNLQQAAATEKGFMKSKWKPSIIIRVDSDADTFSTKEGRRKILNDYIDTNEVGEPWIIPSEQFQVEQIKPLSLSDLALADMVQLDKKTVASILRVPSFVLGVGNFNKEEWNNFINSTIMPIAQMIQQELTKKLLYSPDLYFRFNPRSLYNYSLDETVKAGAEMVDRMAMRRNEWRDWVGLPPDEEMNELLGLENYLPVELLGQQKKLLVLGDVTNNSQKDNGGDE